MDFGLKRFGVLGWGLECRGLGFKGLGGLDLGLQFRGAVRGLGSVGLRVSLFVGVPGFGLI